MKTLNKIGRKLFFDLTTGNVIVDTGERMGSVVSTTIERDIEVYKELSERNRKTFDVLELEYGAYAQDFATCTDYRINLETMELEFSYPDPNEPTAEPEFVSPLTEEIKTLKSDKIVLENYVLDMDYRLTLKELGL